MPGSTPLWGSLEMLGWSVAHTLWQAGGILLTVRLLHRSLPFSAARARYRVALLGFVGVLLLWMATSTWLVSDWRTHTRCWSPPDPADALNLDICRSHGRDIAGLGARVTQEVPASEVVGAAVRALATPTGDLIGPIPARVTYALTPLIGPLALGWLLVAVVLALGTLKGLLVLAAIRRNAGPIAGRPGAARPVRRFLGRHIHAEVRTTTRLRAPGAAGFFRPVILIPEGVEERLDRDQMQHLLAHEMAHVQSLDYPVGIVQLLAVRLLFFNPWLRALSRIVSHEREALRDREAVGVAGSAKGYAETLLRLEQLRLPGRPSPPVLSLQGEGALLDRVGRFVSELPGETGRLRTRTAGPLWVLATVALAVVVQLTCTAGALASWAVMEGRSPEAPPTVRPHHPIAEVD